MKYAEIKDGKVVNILIAEPDVAAERGWVECPIGGIGWDYDGSTFVDNRPEPVAPITSTPTKEELLAQLQSMQELQTQLQTQIQALE